MKRAVDLNVARKMLNRLCIAYRELPCKNGLFFCCKNPANGISFDVKIDEDGTVRIWRFVGTASVCEAGRRYEYRAPQYPHAVIGIEVTDEGDIGFYAQQKMDTTDPRSIAGIGRMISGYIDLMTDSSLACSL